MKQVYKYILTPYRTEYSLPVGAKILTVSEQGGDICMWVEVYVNYRLTETRNIFIIGTGMDMPECECDYLGTAFLNNSSLVLHVYEMI